LRYGWAEALSRTGQFYSAIIGQFYPGVDNDTPITPMNQIYYNFIRPHMGLEGATPAEAAGVGIEEENKWMGLLRRSITKNE